MEGLSLETILELNPPEAMFHSQTRMHKQRMMSLQNFRFEFESFLNWGIVPVFLCFCIDDQTIHRKEILFFFFLKSFPTTGTSFFVQTLLQRKKKNFAFILS